MGKILFSHSSVGRVRAVLEEEVVQKGVNNDKDALRDVLGWEVDGAADVGDVCDARQ